MTARWDKYFLGMALVSARMSRDPRTQVGCVAVGPDREVRATGYNGLPRGIADTPVRLNDRNMKLRLTVHAERNVICSAARIGVPLKGCRLYVACMDHTGLVYGGPPCTACAIEVIQAGIVEVVHYPFKDGFSNWREDLAFAKELLFEAGLRVREVAL